MNAINFYRVANFSYVNKIPLVPTIIKYLIFLLFNSVVPCTISIGRNSRFMYGGIGVVIHKNAIIGNNVAIGQGVTVGRKLKDSCPIICDDVYIGAGSRLLGNIKVGKNVIIGANSVVVSDIPDNSIVAGNPAKIIRKVNKSIWKELGEVL